MTSETIEKKKPEKFLFGTHNFDEPDEDDLDADPPPPTYSQEDLDAATRDAAAKAHAKGREEAFAEAKASLDQQVANVLGAINQNIGRIIDAELTREKSYEQESVRLSLAVFKKIFPHIQEKYGFEELSNILEKTVNNQEVQSKISIQVPPEVHLGVQAFIEQTFPSAAQSRKIEVLPNETVPAGGCKLSWSDGGAVRDTQAIADEITRLMEEALAGTGANVHDSGDENIQASAGQDDIDQEPVSQEPEEGPTEETPDE